MITRNRILVAVLGVAVLACSAFWLWPRTVGENPVDKEGLFALTAGLRRLLTPPPVTEKDIAAVRWFGDQTAESAGGVRYAAITGLRALLELETNGTADHVLAKDTLDSGGHVVTELWSHKAGKSLTIEWADRRVSLGPRRTDKSGLTFSECWRRDRGTGPQREVSIGFGYSRPDLGEGPLLGIRTRSDGKDRYAKIPYAHEGFQAAPCYAGGDYAIGILPKLPIEGSCKLVGLLVVDVEKGQLVREIKPPPDLQQYGRGRTAVDSENCLMLTLTSQVEAMMLIDLRGYFGKGGK